MAENEYEIDLERARLDPGSVFSSPEALHDFRGLTQDISLWFNCGFKVYAASMA